MWKEREVSEAEKLLQIKESIINSLYSLKNVERDYLSIINKLLDYWKDKLDNVGSEDKKKEKILEKIKSEEATIKKIKKDIHDIDKLIEKYEKDLEKK